MSKRILLSVAYDGTDYAGFQAQKSGVPTIEGELNRALTELTGVPVEVIGASRTDSGVHARCNLAVFDTESRIPPEKFAHAINVRLPDQICVQTSMEVPADFHPRRCSTVKTYEYRIWNAQMPDPMRRLYTYFSRYRFDIDKMREAAAYLVGEHDFKSFCSTYTSAKTTVREVLAVEVEEILPGCETALPGSETALPGSETALPGSEIAQVLKSHCQALRTFLTAVLMPVPVLIPSVPLPACRGRSSSASLDAAFFTIWSVSLREP